MNKSLTSLFCAVKQLVIKIFDSPFNALTILNLYLTIDKFTKKCLDITYKFLTSGIFVVKKN